jgi:hypothetical protein
MLSAVVMLAVVGVSALPVYFVAVRFGPENWRINAQGKAAFAALTELETSLATPIGRDEYGQCLRRALVVVRPYLESENAIACPDFSEWIDKAAACYRKAAEDWNGDNSYSGNAADVIGGIANRALVKIRWLQGSRYLLCARNVLHGMPNKEDEARTRAEAAREDADIAVVADARANADRVEFLAVKARIEAEAAEAAKAAAVDGR